MCLDQMFIVFCSMGFGKHPSKAQQPNGRRACNDAEDRMEDTSKPLCMQEAWLKEVRRKDRSSMPKKRRRENTKCTDTAYEHHALTAFALPAL